VSGAAYYGKYRGTVIDNVDPLRLGRVQAMVPSIGGQELTTWALPCVPLAGPSMGTYFVPQVGAGVWIEFEAGDVDFPVWTGCYWTTAAEVPAPPEAGESATPGIVIQTGMQHSIVLSDAPGPTGGIMLRSATGATILVNDAGITITNGKGATIELTGPTVSINGGALTVT
jgi:uncharacterized protein involved in type VI secretion and phage assembly